MTSIVPERLGTEDYVGWRMRRIHATTMLRDVIAPEATGDYSGR
jgi:hypothetical protein